MTGDMFMKLMICLYAAASVAYAYEGNLPKFLYFSGSVVLSIGVLWMR